jgi:LysR family hca operon transcriptional activator
MDWLPALMGILRDALPSSEITIRSLQSPDLAAGLMRGRIDLAFLRPEQRTPSLIYRTLLSEPLIVLMPADHALAAKATVSPRDIVGQTLIGVPNSNSPALRAVTDRYGAQQGIDLTPDYEALNLAMAISLVASTGGVSLLPLYARKMLPPPVVSRPLEGVPPTIDLALGYNEANGSPLLRFLLSKIEDLKFRVSGGRES